MLNNLETLKKVLQQTKREVAKVIIGHEYVVDQAPVTPGEDDVVVCQCGVCVATLGAKVDDKQ